MRKKMMLLIAILFLVSCSKRQSQPVSTDYKTMSVQTTNQTLFSEFSASIRGRQTVDIYPQITGTLTSVLVHEGADVRKGELLFVIDQAPYKAALEKAKANVESATAALATAKMTYDSKQDLFNENVVSDFDLQSAKNSWLTQKATLEQAKAELISAKTNLSYTEIRSPASGSAGMVSLRVGALVNSSMSEPLITISDNNEMQIYFSMSEKQYLSYSNKDAANQLFSKNMPEVELKLNDGTRYNQKGKIDAISGIVDYKTGSITVRATFPNPDKLLKSGSTGVLLLPYNKNNCIVIPQEATYEIQDKIFVYRVVDGKAKSTEVNVFPINNGTQYIVESGLTTGDVIIAEGAGLVQDGSAVTTKNKK